jgi:hypothetical protein
MGIFCKFPVRMNYIMWLFLKWLNSDICKRTDDGRHIMEKLTDICDLKADFGYSV